MGSAQIAIPVQTAGATAAALSGRVGDAMVYLLGALFIYCFARYHGERP